MIYPDDELIAATLRALNHGPERSLFAPSQLTAITQAFNFLDSPWAELMVQNYAERQSLEEIAARVNRRLFDVARNIHEAVTAYRWSLRKYGVMNRHGFIPMINVQYVGGWESPPRKSSALSKVSAPIKTRIAAYRKATIHSLRFEIFCPLCQVVLEPRIEADRFGRCHQCYLAIRLELDPENNRYRITIFNHAGSPMPESLEECHACLGSSSKMTPTEIREKYISRLKYCHPDRAHGLATEVRAAAEHLTKQVTTAWKMIKSHFSS